MRIGIALFEDAEELDFAGPWEVLAAWAKQFPDDGVEVFTVAESLEPVRCAKGLRVLPDRIWETAGTLDMLVYPGGAGSRRELLDEAVLGRLRSYAKAGTLMTSVCTGALVFAAAGLLDGRPATTWYGALEQLSQLGSDDRGAARGALRRLRRGGYRRRRLGRNRHGAASRRPAALAGAGTRGAPLHPVRPRASGLGLLAGRAQSRPRLERRGPRPYDCAPRLTGSHQF